MEHPITAWLKRHGKTQTWLAQQCGVSVGLVSDVVRGKKPPGRRSAEAMRDATGGEVTLDELFAWRVPEQDSA